MSNIIRRSLCNLSTRRASKKNRNKKKKRRTISMEERKKGREEGDRLSQSGKMPTNYECKVMVILISSEDGKNGCNKADILLFLSLLCHSLPFLDAFSPGPRITLFGTFLMYDRSNLSRIG